MIARRSPKVKDGRQQGTRVSLSDAELLFLRQRAKKKGLSISNLIRSSVAKDAAEDGDEVPGTLCNASDVFEGHCGR